MLICILKSFHWLVCNKGGVNMYGSIYIYIYTYIHMQSIPRVIHTAHVLFCFLALRFIPMLPIFQGYITVTWTITPLYWGQWSSNAAHWLICHINAQRADNMTTTGQKGKNISIYYKTYSMCFITLLAMVISLINLWPGLIIIAH